MVVLGFSISLSIQTGFTQDLPSARLGDSDRPGSISSDGSSERETDDRALDAADLEKLEAEFSFGAGELWFPEPGSEAITLDLHEFRQRVIARNESVQSQLLGILIGEKKFEAATGIFEPEFVAGFEHRDSRRPNTAEQRRNLGERNTVDQLPDPSQFQDPAAQAAAAEAAAAQAAIAQNLTIFDERNNVFTNGVEALFPTNARFRLGFDVYELQNNIQLPTESPEYTSFVGVNVTQPLLRNAGKTASMAVIRLAAIESEVAFQEYRSGLMTTLAAAELAYWNVYYAAQEKRLNEESLDLAETIYADALVGNSAGKAPASEVLAAKVGVLERQSMLSSARQLLLETTNVMVAYYSGGGPGAGGEDSVITEPPPRPGLDLDPDIDAIYTLAFESNPDYVTRRKQIAMEKIRVAYLKNQTRPQLDLKGSYGLNGLGTVFDAALDDIGASEFTAWTVGVEFRLPLAGGITARKELDAGTARKIQALLGLKEVEIQLNTALDNTIAKIASTSDRVQANRAAVSLNQQILDDERTRLAAGSSEIRKVLEVEQDLFVSKNTVLKDIIEYQRARLELELVMGTVLMNRGWELSQQQLREKTNWILTEASAQANADGRDPKSRRGFLGLFSDPVTTETTANDDEYANTENRTRRPINPSAGADVDLRGGYISSESLGGAGASAGSRQTAGPESGVPADQPRPTKKGRFGNFRDIWKR